MRIKLQIEAGRLDDALIILETVGFAPDDLDGAEWPPDVEVTGVRSVTGDLPDDALGKLSEIDGIRDWQVLSEGSKNAPKTWPWNQNPETD